MGSPEISVILSNYNYGHYLRQCLQGILRQTFGNFEIVITDDGSTDGSQEIIAHFAANDKRIKPSYFAKNRGAMAATQHNMERVRGRLIFGEGVDDFIVDDHFFERAVSALATYPEAAGFVGVAGLLSVERNQLVSAMGSAPREGYIGPVECYRGFLRGSVFVPGSSSIWRLDCINAIGGFDYSLGPQTDFVLNHALAAKYGIVHTRAGVTCQRIYENSANYGSKATIWEAAHRYERVEMILRQMIPAYEDMDSDWKAWRIRWMLDVIDKARVGI